MAQSLLIFTFLLGIIQLILAIVFTASRQVDARPISGWKIYWLLVIFYVILLFCTTIYGENIITKTFWLCYIPAIWFFFAGRVSDRRSAVNTKINES
jgi:uncharacterized membrane protein HdeD (DUF308 family)